MNENPYRNLVIYYFDGRICPDAAVEQDPGFLGNWEEAGTSFVFFSRPVPHLAERLAAQHPDARLVDVFEMTGEQWHGGDIAPYRVADFVIAPPWDRPKPEPGTREILLDPGVVFGTGRHPTTETCLTLIQDLCRETAIASVLDLGTGTGLLALAAAAMGCRRVLACDFNLLAVKTARRNILRNGVPDRVLAFQARGESLMSLRHDLLVANIHFDVMRHVVADPGCYANRYLILSGLMTSEVRRIRDVLEGRPVRILDHRCPDGIWHTLLVKSLGPCSRGEDKQGFR